MTIRELAAAAPPAAATVRSRLAPLLIGLLAAGISLVAIGTPSIWYDEAATVSSITRSWSQLFDELGSVDAVHALYYVLMHVVVDVFGYTPFTLRLPSALAIGVAAALTVVLGRQLGRPSLGLVGGIVFAVLPRTVWAGGEGRSYALTAAAAVGLTLALVHAVRSRRIGAWIGYAALVALSCVLFVYLALVVLAHATAVVALTRRDRGSRRPFVLAAASGGLLALPLAVIMLGQTGQIEWIPPLSWDSVRDVLVRQWFDPWVGYAIVGWLLVVVGAVTVRRSRRLDDRAAVLLPLVAVPTLVLLGVTAAGFAVYTPRYLTMCLPFVALVIAAAIDAAPWRPARVAALAVIVVLVIPVLLDQRAVGAKEHAAWSQVAAYIGEQKAEAGPTAILYGTVRKHRHATARVISTAYPSAFEGTLDPMLDVPAAETGQLWETTKPLAASLDEFGDATTVFRISSTDDPAAAVLLEGHGWHRVGTKHFTWIDVVEYRR